MEIKDKILKIKILVRSIYFKLPNDEIDHNKIYELIDDIRLGNYTLPTSTKFKFELYRSKKITKFKEKVNDNLFGRP